MIYTAAQTLLTNMQASITTVNGYNTSPLIRRGLIAYDKCENYPFLGFEIDSVELEPFVGDSVGVKLGLYVYGHSKRDHLTNPPDSTSFDLLEDALEYFYNRTDFGTSDFSKTEINAGANDYITFAFTCTVHITTTRTNINA